MPVKGWLRCGKNMAYKIVRTDSYQRDLDSAVGYIVLSLVNKTAAVSLLDAIEKVYDDLERMPLMYGFCDDPHLRDLKYHKAVIKNYIMVYTVDEAQKTVNILRFFHGRQDYEKLI